MCQKTTRYTGLINTLAAHAEDCVRGQHRIIFFGAGLFTYCLKENQIMIPICEYCSDPVLDDCDLKTMPDDLPDDLPWGPSWDTMHYHGDCFENAVHDYRQEITTKHGEMI